MDGLKRPVLPPEQKVVSSNLTGRTTYNPWRPLCGNCVWMSFKPAFFCPSVENVRRSI
jgi:hypothetical protein